MTKEADNNGRPLSLTSSPGTGGEQTTLASEQKRGFFSRKPKVAATNDTSSTLDEKGTASTAVVKAEEPAIQPASFTSLFRFSTKFELFLDAIGLVCAIAAGAAQPLMSLLFGRLTASFVTFGIAVQNLKNNGDITNTAAFEAARDDFQSLASRNALYLVIIGIGMFAATYIYMVTWVYTGEVNAKRIREKYLQAVLRQDIAFFDDLGAGEVATRIQTDTHLIQQGMSEKVAVATSFISAFFTGFILAYVRSWRLSLAISTILPCIGITGALMNKFVSAYMQLSLKHVAAGGSLAEEIISTIRTAQAFGTQEKLSVLYDGHINQALKADYQASIVHGCCLGVFFFCIYGAYALAFSFGTTLILEGYGDVGVLVNVFIAILIGSFSLALLAPEMQAISSGRGAASKIFSTIDRVPPIDSASNEGLRPAKVTGRITFEDIKFEYPSRPDVPVLKGISIDFEAGKTAALVGASGSGKSTIVSLVERFYDPIAGSIKFDGVDIKDLNLRWLRSQIGLVSQEPTLFATTIRANVAHGLVGTPHENAAPEKQMELIREACVKANADGFISKLPEGYETLVGESGFLLSGGQKQRVAIARAIVSDPAILLLDEATSALDTQSEGIVQNALDKAAAGRTTITIAHRLSTIRDADCIYVMGTGHIIEKGTHDELLSSNGAYARLVSAQKLREQERSTADAHDPTGVATGETGLDPLTMTEEEVQKAARTEVPLGRTGTGSQRSLASEVLERKKKDGTLGDGGERQYSMYYLFRRMAHVAREDWVIYSWGIFFSCITGLIYPAFGIVYGIAIQSFQLQDRHSLRRAGDRSALWFFLIAVASTVAIALQNFCLARGAAMLVRKLRSQSFRAILRQDIGWFDEEDNSTGALTSNLSDAPQKVNGLAGITLGAIIQAIATLIGGAIVGLVYGWKLALVGIATTPFLVSMGYIRLRVVVLKDQANKKAHAHAANVACEAAGAIRTVAALTREQACTDTYSRSLEQPLRNSNRTALWTNGLFAISQASSFFAIALVFWYGSRLVGSLEYGTKAFFICLMSVTFGAIQAGNVFSFVPDMSSAKGAATDIVNLLDSRPEIDAESTEGTKVTGAQGQITLEDIHFRYPTRPGVRVLRNLNIVVEPGTYVALVGASGSGKSTVIQLVERFYDPLAGRVLLDGQNIAELNVQDYRKQIALVSQEPRLYSGSIRFNILLGATGPAEDVTQAQLEAAARDANILEFILSLPQGFDTEVGGKGSQLSGGQKQRIAIARALLRNPKVLLLDEATSALDSESEKVVQAALDTAAKGRTTIAIAHRLSTIQNADRIYFIKDGKVSESGTHNELLQLRGGYFELVQMQDLAKH